MPRKSKSGAGTGAGSTDHVDPPNDPPKDINPYEVLGIESTATTGQIRSAYLKLALKLHPDKIQSTATESEKATAHAKFQELAFAYSVLSDPARKARYDTTGSTSDRITGEEDFFDWANFYRSQFKEVVTTAHIEEFRKKYQGSEEERDDVLKEYEDGEGDVDYLFERVMCSEEERDLERFREIVVEAVKKGEVPRFEKFWKGDGGHRKKKRKGEEEEAKEYARKLGVYEVLFGKDGTEEAGPSDSGKAGEKKMDLEGEAEVSGEDSGDEEDDGAVAEEDDGFIVNGEEDEEVDEVMKEDQGDEEEDEAPKKATRSKRSTRASGKTKKEGKSSLKESKADFSVPTPASTSKPTRASKAKPETKTEPKTTSKTKSSTTTSKKSRKEKDADSNLAGLEALIRSRQKDRFADMISNIEDRYVNKSSPNAKHVSSQSLGGKGAGRKRKVDDEDLEMVDADDDAEEDQGPEPTDEEFEKIRARLEGRKKGAKSKENGEDASVAAEGKGRGKKRGRK